MSDDQPADVGLPVCLVSFLVVQLIWWPYFMHYWAHLKIQQVAPTCNNLGPLKEPYKIGLLHFIITRRANFVTSVKRYLSKGLNNANEALARVSLPWVLTITPLQHIDEAVCAAPSAAVSFLALVGHRTQPVISLLHTAASQRHSALR